MPIHLRKSSFPGKRSEKNDFQHSERRPRVGKAPLEGGQGRSRRISFIGTLLNARRVKTPLACVIIEPRPDAILRQKCVYEFYRVLQPWVFLIRESIVLCSKR